MMCYLLWKFLSTATFGTVWFPSWGLHRWHGPFWWWLFFMPNGWLERAILLGTNKAILTHMTITNTQENRPQRYGTCPDHTVPCCPQYCGGCCVPHWFCDIWVLLDDWPIDWLTDWLCNKSYKQFLTFSSFSRRSLFIFSCSSFTLCSSAFVLRSSSSFLSANSLIFLCSSCCICWFASSSLLFILFSSFSMWTSVQWLSSVFLSGEWWEDWPTRLTSPFAAFFLISRDFCQNPERFGCLTQACLMLVAWVLFIPIQTCHTQCPGGGPAYKQLRRMSSTPLLFWVSLG